MGDNNPNFIFLIRGPEINKVPKNVVLVCSYATVHEPLADGMHRSLSGNPTVHQSVHQSVGQYGNVDNSISKFLILNRKGQTEPLD